MISDRKVESENIVMQSAIDNGIEFLKKIGVENVEETYYLKTENMVTINYAAKQDEIILYPDLVKVKVALDTGEICSVESQGYIFNHEKRENITPSITIDEARNIVTDRVKVLAENLVIIPTESQSEVLCYEFKGKIEDREVLIYVNAITGLEEKILLILETPGGTLTI
jgi:germination protein YpeB